MIRKLSLIMILLATLLCGCFEEEKKDEADRISFSYFQDRFDDLPNDTSASAWDTVSQVGGNILKSRILTDEISQSQCELQVLSNSKGYILQITLRCNEADFAFGELCYHAFCAMSFDDPDGKGNQPFGDVAVFSQSFEMTSESPQYCMWIDRYKVTHEYDTSTLMRTFSIVANEQN